MQMSDQHARGWPAPAKINLFLHVMGRRPDGYHELQTCFQILDWGDDVHIKILPNGEISRPRASYPVDEEDDLVVKAARLLQAETGAHLGAEIEVTKRIPAGAGLGGGSSDAATVLLVLNRLWNCRLSIDELSMLGRQLGADLPVFVRGHSALATGIGDLLQPLALGERYYLLVFPDFSVSTREVFSDPDLPRNSSSLSLREVLDGKGTNDCESVVIKRYPAFEKIIRDLREIGQPRMTGTGSGIFIPMSDKKTAIEAAQKIKCRYNVRAVRGIDRSPLLDLLESGEHHGQ
jgi:4-diphosphocytidyl-2-C-methyl-D-erythritol kinase